MSAIVIQIPNSIIRNEDGYNLNPTEFLLAYYLCVASFNRHGARVFDIEHSELKTATLITDNRTLKKSLTTLYEQGLIFNKINDLPRGNGLLRIELTDALFDKSNFTQLPLKLNSYVPQIGAAGVRLMYLYESYINRKTKTCYAFPSYKEICKRIGISHTSLAKYNQKLVDTKLLKIEKHKIGTEHGYDENGNLLYVRYNNHYKPQIHVLTRTKKESRKAENSENKE